MLATSHEATQLITTEIWHHGVGNDEVNSRVEQKLHRLQTISRHGHLITGPLQHNLEVSSQGAVVLHEQHSNAFARRFYAVHALGRIVHSNVFTSNHWGMSEVLRGREGFEGAPRVLGSGINRVERP